MRRRTASVLVVLGLLVVGCGSQTEAGETEPETTTTTTTTTTSGASTSTATTRDDAAPRETTTTGGSETTTTRDDSTGTRADTTTTVSGGGYYGGGADTGGEDPDDSGEAAEIDIEGFSFGRPIEIPVGTDVTVTNLDSVAHTWTSTDGLFDGRLGPDESLSHTFDQPGEYTFLCEIHPSMTGSITVTG